MCHFRFAQLLLDKLWLLNLKLQEQFALLPVVLSSITQTKEMFKQHLSELKRSCYEKFDYIRVLSDWEKKTFEEILQKLLLNLDIRFPCPSTSVDLRIAKQKKQT